MNIYVCFFCAKAVKCTAFVGAICCLNLIGGACKIEYSNQSSLSVSSTLNCLYKVPFFVFAVLFLSPFGSLYMHPSVQFRFIINKKKRNCCFAPDTQVISSKKKDFPMGFQEYFKKLFSV